MKLAFDENAADFSGMTGNRELVISELIHKTFVDVDEEGTEAAATTTVAIPLALAASPQKPKKKPPVFRADHPFVFMIRDNRNGLILFLGRIANPLE